ncbi:uncharacterized protein LOC129764947 [Toxorhynchites rutilus septentrionalis]|uniref:uncharacterized protein LOC129764947 n=1 Tax=Toxorhynchites rutilus septentrionalis TaxID=329112 RepID=UPI00247ABAF4|nr:uncharacterized protein LOC129764947 [Toxorhynchites rutilus septentrionalis]
MVLGRKGRPMLLMGGYAFFRNNSNKNKTYWLCSKSRSLKCRARIITLDGSADSGPVTSVQSQTNATKNQTNPVDKTPRHPARRPPKRRKYPKAEEILATRTGTPVVFLNSRFGAAPVLLDDQTYQFCFTQKQISFYRCAQFRKSDCPSRVMVKDGVVYYVCSEHSHLESTAPPVDSGGIYSRSGGKK